MQRFVTSEEITIGPRTHAKLVFEYRLPKGYPLELCTDKTGEFYVSPPVEMDHIDFPAFKYYGIRITADKAEECPNKADKGVIQCLSK